MGSGYRTFTAGEILTASNVQNYLMDQSVMSFADSTARATGIGTANFEEGMLSYLADTNQLEVYDGAAWSQIGQTPGLVKINTTSFSGVSSQSINDVFSATYNNYRIVCHINNTSTADGLLMRLRVSGADNTTANYNYARTESNSSATANRYGAGQTSFDVNSTDDGGLAVGFVLDLEAPFAANHTVGQINVMGQNSSGAYSSRVGGYVFSATTSFTGYTVYPGSGTITGSISTYAYNA